MMASTIIVLYRSLIMKSMVTLSSWPGLMGWTVTLSTNSSGQIFQYLKPQSKITWLVQVLQTFLAMTFCVVKGK